MYFLCLILSTPNLQNLMIIWLAFLLRTKIKEVGLTSYLTINEEIFSLVFSCLKNNPHLHVTYFSSGVALSSPKSISYESDPYLYLKLKYQSQLSEYCSLLTVFPYATLGRYVPDNYSFAVSSFIHQAKRNGCISIKSRGVVVRSYGFVNDFCRLLLSIYGQLSQNRLSAPATIIPVSHTLDLYQLAAEVFSALNLECNIMSSMTVDSNPRYISATIHHIALNFLNLI